MAKAKRADTDTNPHAGKTRSGPANSGKAARAKALRGEQAQERDYAHSQRTIDEQLALIDARPGNSARERARLEAKRGGTNE